MKLGSTTARRLAFVILVGFLGFLFWRLAERRGSEVELVYDLSRTGRTDLVELRVEIRHDGTLARRAGFFYSRQEGSAPVQQRHLVRLADGQYVASFLLRFAQAPPRRVKVPFRIPQPEPVVIRIPRP